VPTEPAVVELLRSLELLLARWGGAWYVFGAQAVIAYGVPRLTDDVDVTVWLEPDDPSGFVREAVRHGFELRISGGEDFVRRTRVLPFRHETGLDLDVVLGGSGLEREFLARARDEDVGGVRVPILGPTDLVIAKVLAGRTKDLEDVRGVLRVRAGDVDRRRVRRLLRELEEALGQSDLVATFDRVARQVRRPPRSLRS
jgi:hypothetical protein